MAASYPSSVKSFSTKAANDTIEASHPNDLQDEVTAIENGLLSGLAHTLAIATNNAFGIGTSAKKWLDAFVTTFKAALGSEATPSYSFDGDLNTGMFSSGADVLDFATAGLNRLQISSGGVVVLQQGQLAFPATQNASVGSNVLDDYEEGSWTPVIGGSGGTSGQTYSVQQGNYIKIGREVHARFTVTLSNKGTITGNVEIQGLPGSLVSEATYFSVGSLNWDVLATTWVNVIPRLGPSATAMQLLGATVAATTNSTNLTTAAITNTTQFIGYIAYRAAN